MGAHGEEFGETDPDDEGDDLAADHVAGLREGGFDDAEFEDGCCSLDRLYQMVSKRYRRESGDTHKTSNNHRNIIRLKRRNAHRHSLDDGQACKHTDKRPQRDPDIANLFRGRCAVAEEVGDDGWEMVPWRGGEVRVEVVVDVDVPDAHRRGVYGVLLISCLRLLFSDG